MKIAIIMAAVLLGACATDVTISQKMVEKSSNACALNGGLASIVQKKDSAVVTCANGAVFNLGT